MERYIKLIKRLLDADEGLKSLGRLSGGSRSKALDIVKKCAGRYPSGVAATPDQEREFSDAFDIALAEMFGGGCEIEWVTE